MKPYSKQKRRRADIEDVKEEETSLRKDKQVFLQNVKRLKQETQEVKKDNFRLRAVEQMMEGLVK